jgi:hypothetical protein
MSTRAEGDEASRVEQPAGRSRRDRALRVIGLGLTCGAVLLFVCRDLAKASPATCVAGVVVGVLLGIGLGLVEPEPAARRKPPATPG